MSNKYMPIDEFRNIGFLQEVNRQFFHPLGLALSITIDKEQKYRLDGILDYRDDPEGIYFDMDLSEEKAKNVAELRDSKEAVRKKLFGSTIQPIKKCKKEE